MKEDTAGLAGLGLLGRSIAACLLAYGLRVVIYTPDNSEHPRAKAYIAEAIGELIDRAGFDPALADNWQERYVMVDSLARFSECGFVLESVLEDAAIKASVFDAIEAAVEPDVPIASNTSALPISLLQKERRHPERFLGMHWAGPAYSTRFMELIRGEKTNDETFARAERFARRIGKDPCLVQKDVPGFIANRLAYAMYREALHLLESGVADAETIDRAFQNACGLWASLCGPFRWMDISGGPALYAKVMEGMLPHLNRSPELPETMKSMIERGARGVMDGQGFYSYRPEDARLWEQRLNEHCWEIRGLQEKLDPGSSNG